MIKRVFAFLLLAGASYAANPNIVLIMVDDMGFSDIGCYGAEIQTPNLDALAANGISFREFYNTSKCFPTRASLMTGVYAHQNGFDNSSDSYLKNSVTLGEVLRAAGYHTYASGKHHSLDNLYDRGFDHYYGLRDGVCNHFNPGLQRDGEPPPARKNTLRYWADDSLVFSTRDSAYQSYFREIGQDPDGNDRYSFYSTDAFTAKAQEYLTEWETQNTGRPFFLYLPYTAPHDPIMAWPEDIAKYEGVYDVGYDTIRNARYQKQLDIGLLNSSQHALSVSTYEDWNSLSADAKASQARKMQVYAAMIDRVDQKIGDLIAQLQQMGVYDDTLILFCSDNGAATGTHDFGDVTAEIGGVARYVSVTPSWANVSNTPFRYFKDDSDEGGIRAPLVAHWPNGIVNPGRFADKTTHLIDFMATFVEMTGADYPRFYNGTGVTPMQGDSFTDVLYDQAVTSRSPLYFEWSDGRAVRDGDYKLVSRDSGSSWKLFDMSTDATELNDLSSSLPSVKSSLLTKFNTWWTAVNGNDLPTAYDDTAQMTYPGSVDVDVLSNDVDSDGSINASTLVITRAPANGTAVINPDDTINYAATAAFVTDEFYYQVRDNDGEISNEGRVTIRSQDAPPIIDKPDVFIVSSTAKGGDAEAAAMSAWLSANFAGQLGTVTVNEHEAGAPGAAGAGDLVIFMRTLNNGGYDETGEPASWNNLEAGILMLSPFQVEDDNLGWITTTDQNELTSPAGAETAVADENDSLFDGVTITGGYADLITDGTAYKSAETAGFDSSEVVGTTTLTTAGDSIVLARIAKGSAWSETSGGTSGTHGGDRIVFNFLQNPGILTDDLTADGQLVLENAIAELLPELVLEPATIVGGLTVLPDGVLKLEVSGASPPEYYYPESTTNLVDGPWGRIPHSDAPGNPFIETNFNYSTTDGTNRFIYLQSGDNEFFKIEIAE